MKKEVKKQIEVWRKLVDSSLKKNLSSKPNGFNDTVYSAMRYSVFSGGKRIRPLLAIASADACGLKTSQVLPVACAIELIHSYSLIHDDLPCMDNSDFRRGKLTVHKKFNEGLAVLTGDALLTKAFELITTASASAQKVSRVIETITKAIGPEGMIGGQVADTFLDYRKLSKQRQKSLIDYIHSRKTGDLLEASVTVGAVLSGASSKKLNALRKYGRIIGFVFQIVDDIFDEDKNRLTYPCLFGKESSKETALKLIEEAKGELKVLGKKAYVLRALADYVVERTN